MSPKRILVRGLGLQVFVKELLTELCVFNKRGNYQGTWELKPEYQKKEGGGVEVEVAKWAMGALLLATLYLVWALVHNAWLGKNVLCRPTYFFQHKIDSSHYLETRLKNDMRIIYEKTWSPKNWRKCPAAAPCWRCTMVEKWSFFLASKVQKSK